MKVTLTSVRACNNGTDNHAHKNYEKIHAQKTQKDKNTFKPYSTQALHSEIANGVHFIAVKTYRIIIIIFYFPNFCYE